MSRHEIESKLADIFINRFSIDFIYTPSLKETKLLGSSGITARELLHVYFDVKRTFKISIPENDVIKGRFDTFAHITDIIYEQLNT